MNGRIPPRPRFLVPSFIFCALLLLAAPCLADRRADAALAGVVKDQAGEPLEGVKLEVVGADGTVIGETTTDRRGELELELVAGAYKVRFSAEGYASFEGSIALESGMQQDLAVTLLDGLVLESLPPAGSP